MIERIRQRDYQTTPNDPCISLYCFHAREYHAPNCVFSGCVCKAFEEAPTEAAKRGQLFYARTPQRGYTNIFRVVRVNKLSMRVQHLLDDLNAARFKGIAYTQAERNDLAIRQRDIYQKTYPFNQWRQIVPKYWRLTKSKEWATYKPK